MRAMVGGQIDLGGVETVKYSDDTNERRKANIDYVSQRWSQLYGLERETAADGIKYLFLVNSGAAVAVLAFHGSVPSVREMVWPKVMLGLFVIGLILIGFLHIMRYVGMTDLFRNWRDLVNEYFSDSKGWQEVVEADNKKAGGFRFSDWVAYASFACFVIGAGVGMFNFSSLNSGDSNVRKETITQPSSVSKTGQPSDTAQHPNSGKNP